MTGFGIKPQTGRPRAARAWVLGVALGLVAPSIRPADTPGPLRVVGSIPHGDDLSAVACVGAFLVVASDEGAELSVLEPADEPNTYRVRPDAIRLAAGDGELDVEALARDGDTLYALGSHSLKRKLLDPSDSVAKNRERLATVSDEPLRQRIYRVRLDSRTGRPAGPPEWISLRPLLERDRLLGPFTRIPAEENGVNLEGLAAEGGGVLYLGFRSPVLREGLVPVMRTSWSKAPAGELRWLDLDGRGIRSLERVDGGFLMLARREREDCDSDAIYFWDGADQIPGADAPPRRIERLLELAPPRGGATEGLCVTGTADDHWDVVVVHDGIPGGHLLRLRVGRHHPPR